MNREVELLEKARAGDPAAGEELYVRYLKDSKSIRGLLARGLSNPEDRGEMLHEIYLQLISGANTFRGDSQLATYIYQVARITVLQKYRRDNTLKRGKIYRVISEPVDIADGVRSNPEYTYAAKEAREILRDLIAKLPEAYRDVLTLRVLEDQSYEEIASKLKLPLNTVSTKIHKGKKLLGMILKERGITEVFDF